MSRSSLLAPLAYGALLASLFTPLYDFASAGRDQSWALLILLIATPVGLELSVRGGWVMAGLWLPCLTNSFSSPRRPASTRCGARED